jgi:hypothetical protein
MTPMTQARASDMLPKQISGPLTDSNANKVNKTSPQNSTASLRVVSYFSVFTNTMYCKLVHKFGRDGSILCSDWLTRLSHRFTRNTPMKLRQIMLPVLAVGLGSIGRVAVVRYALSMLIIMLLLA